MSDTKERIIQTTCELLELQGYNGTGLNQIVKESQTPKGSLYHHFPDGKEEIAAEAIMMKSENIANLLRQMLAGKPDVAAAVRDHVLFMASIKSRFGPQIGSPIAAVALETSMHSERLREACETAYSNIEAVFYEHYVQGGIAEDIAKRLAGTTIAMLEGSVIRSRTQNSTAPIENTAHILYDLIQCLRG